MIFSDPPFSAAQLTEFEENETFHVDVSVDEDGICCKSSDVCIDTHGLPETSLGNSYVDVGVVRSANSDFIDHISSGPLDTFRVFSSHSLFLPSPKYRNMSLINY